MFASSFAFTFAWSCATEAAERVLRIVATAELHGTTEPCGCTSDPLGDVARVRGLVGDGLWVDAGGLLYDPERKSAREKAQGAETAKWLAKELKLDAVGLGAGDLVRGARGIAPSRLAANVTGLSTRPAFVKLVNGVKVGLFGVVSAKLSAKGLRVSSPSDSARAEIGKLERLGAEVIVALLAMPRAEARGVMHDVKKISVGIVGADVGEGMPEAEPIDEGILVAPADQGRRVASIELHLLADGKKPQLFAGQAARELALSRAERRIAALEIDLARFAKDPSADAAFIAARKRELETLRIDRLRLSSERPTTPSSSYATYALVSVKRKLARDPDMAKRMSALDRAIGQANLKHARTQVPIPADKGQAHYVGVDACAKCHKPAVELWRTTVHARAWKTLTSANKQYNYECASCHATGLDVAGGPTLATIEKAKLVDVQCEVCHGPGSKHVEDAGMEEPSSLVLKQPDRFCRDQCHAKEHSDTFDLAPYLRDILGKGHGEKRRAALGAGPTGHELREAALKANASH